MIGDEERNAVMDVLSGPILVHGPRAKAFEQSFASFTGSPHAVSVSSCTSGMYLAYFGKNIGAGDEVIVPAQTHVATAHVVEILGARPVFVDAEDRTGNIDIEAIEAAITERTRAIAVVHYLGEPVDMTRVCEIARARDLMLVEDCALAIGTYHRGVHAGLHGDLGAFSFYPVKHITTAEGGMVITRHDDVATAMTRHKAFGVDRTVDERTVPGVYDVTMLGANFRLNEMQAALGIEQMKRVPDFLARRRENYVALRSAVQEISEITLLPASEGENQSSYYCASAVLTPELESRRFDVVEHLKTNGIGTSVYYPRPVPLLSYYAEKYGYHRDTFPVASWISYCSIALPVGPHLDPDDMLHIASTLKKAIEEIT